MGQAMDETVGPPEKNTSGSALGQLSNPADQNSTPATTGQSCRLHRHKLARHVWEAWPGRNGHRSHHFQSAPDAGARAAPARAGKRSLAASGVPPTGANDRAPRELWRRLEQLGFGGAWCRAVQALRADVPMSVNVPGLQGRVFQATQGLKQGGAQHCADRPLPTVAAEKTELTTGLFSGMKQQVAASGFYYLGS